MRKRTLEIHRQEGIDMLRMLLKTTITSIISSSSKAQKTVSDLGLPQ